MTNNTSYDLLWIPFYSLLSREVRRFMRVIYQTLATPLITSTLYLFIFGISIGKEIRSIQNYPYLAFLVPGLAMMSLLRNAFDNSSGTIVISKFCGELEDMRMVPLSPTQIIWAHGIASLIRGTMVGALTLLVGALFYLATTGEPMPIAHPALLLFFTVLGGLAFAHLGLTVAMYANSFDQVSALNTFILMPLIYLGGVFFSLEHLHPFWQIASQFNPLLYYINGVRYALLGITDVSVTTAVIVSVVTWLGFYCSAYRALKTGSYGRW